MSIKNGTEFVYSNRQYSQFARDLEQEYQICSKILFLDFGKHYRIPLTEYSQACALAHVYVSTFRCMNIDLEYIDKPLLFYLLIFRDGSIQTLQMRFAH